MLISFSIENFRSFQGEQTINLLTSRLDSRSLPHSQQVPESDERVLRVVSLYGANGAGKSNLVRALVVLEQLVLSGVKRDERMPYKPFLLDDESSAKPTVFDVQFIADGEVFRYGICYDAERVHEEWLDVCKGKHEQSLFARINDETGNVSVKFGPSKSDPVPSQIKALAESGIRYNQPFLAEVVDRYEETHGTRFRKVIDWFRLSLGIISPGAQFRFLANKVATDKNFAAFAEEFLREAGTGISGIKVDTKTIPRKKLPPLSQDVEKAIDTLAGTTAIPFGPEGEEIIVDASRKDVVKFHKILALHNAAKGNPVIFPLSDESDGSQRLLNLLPALYWLRTGTRVFFIDELERSMHPMLAKKFVEYFLKSGAAANAQLIFTTHESWLLDLDIMQRGGIWFAEKNEAGASQLHSLADFKVRTDLDIEKGYFAGRFGAVPFLGGIDRLMEQTVDSAEDQL